MSVAIRKARPSDLPRLLPLVAAYYAFDSIAYDVDAVRAALSRLLGDKSLGRVWAMETGRGLAGYAVLAYSYDLGFGSQLLSAIVNFCRRAHLYEIELHVTRSNRRALDSYKAFGFRDRQRVGLALEVKQA